MSFIQFSQAQDKTYLWNQEKIQCFQVDSKTKGKNFSLKTNYENCIPKEKIYLFDVLRCLRIKHHSLFTSPL